MKHGMSQNIYLIRANPIQKNNHVLVDSIKRKIIYDKTVAPGDFVGGNRVVLFFLSYKYYITNKPYLGVIIEKMKTVPKYQQRVVLFVLDEENYDQNVICEINLAIFPTNGVLVISQSYAEAARYVEEYSCVKNTSQRKSIELNDRTKVINALAMTTMLNVNDVTTLLERFITLKRIGGADKEELKKCKKLGPKKVDSLWKVLHAPFTVPSNKSIKDFVKTLQITKPSQTETEQPKKRKYELPKEGDQVLEID
ncbi:Mating-type switching protein swi10, putative [Entamoeba invadens IP1]|uniref:Mating-type switching protein swi10, putative n=1 Tax=Entamoeba invadens IP1 TaxID=370355 RepID=A0A0A1U6Z7_ENTIV|nr:Mating-type switching protein swi10, putative [Entamoeba invadens IP1]ELP87744.1 Mating-type switching protein swi10, putative [Entamoeba invadens IP1]|eukprot:XP_004254515.1 Mating-type switching protein swi10, putative [Entamoeba invadens IP1]